MQFRVAVAGLCLVVLLATPRPAWATPVVVVLPPTESMDAWRVPLALAGLEPGGDVVVWFVPVSQGWEIRVVDAREAERLAKVAVPVDAADREDVAFLAASLVSDLRAAALPAPSPPARGRPARPPPPAREIVPEPEPVAAEPKAVGTEPSVDAPTETPIAAPAPPEPTLAEPVDPEPAAPEPAAPEPTPPEPIDAPIARVRTPWLVVLGVGAAATYTPATDPTAAAAGLIGVARRGSGPFVAASATVATPTTVSTGSDAEQVFTADLAGVLGLRGRGPIAPMAAGELLIAYRSYRSGDLQIARLMVPAVGAQAGVDLALSDALRLRLSVHARHDLWSVYVHEAPAAERALSPLGFLVAARVIVEIPASP